MSEDTELAVSAAKEAGALIRRRYGRPAAPVRKGRDDFTTPTDREAELMIIDRLGRTGYSILGEETGAVDKSGSKQWVIDPLDGTANFIKGLPFFAVSIALMQDHDPVIGVVYDPLRDECYRAETGRGAHLNDRKLKVRTGRPDPAGPLVLVEHGSGTTATRDFHKMLAALGSDGLTIQRQGSTALMLCYVARGAADAFAACGDQIYDHAAGLAIARESGAIVSDWHGRPWDGTGSYVLAASPAIHKRLSDLLRYL